MEFVEELEVLEQLFERHKEEHREVLDFRQVVDQCIARQADVRATYPHLPTLEWLSPCSA